MENPWFNPVELGVALKQFWSPGNKDMDPKPVIRHGAESMLMSLGWLFVQW